MGSVGVTTTFVGQSLDKESLPMIQNAECSPSRDEMQLLNSSAAEQLTLVETGVRRDVDSGDTEGDAEQMVPNNLHERGRSSPCPFKHQLTDFIACNNDPPLSPFDPRGSWDTPEWSRAEEDYFNIDSHYDHFGQPGKS
jgi:hypothetical protein